MATVIRGTDDSALTPALTGTDADTGVFFPAANTMAMSTDGTERMRIGSSGNVGIGTTSPFDVLHVEGTIRGNVADAADENIRLTTTGGGGFVIDVDDATVANPTWSIRTFANESLAFDIGGTERARIDSSGNLLFNSGYGSVATAYGCRAWVNFTGTGTVTVNSSGNVTSVTDGGTGTYTVNFTTAMPDANYAAVSGGAIPGGSTVTPAIQIESITTTSFTIISRNGSTGAFLDQPYMGKAVFR